MREKKCCTCKCVKPLEEFYRDCGQTDGREHRCKECRKTSSSRSGKKHKTRRYAKKRAWAVKNKERCRASERNSYRKLYMEKPWRYREKCRTRQASIRSATPPWAKSGRVRDEIKDIYEKCPKDFHVDHIIPLKNDFVCGLHVPWNLQHLPAAENIRKSNKV